MSIDHCSRCILPVSYPGITFDKEHVCHLCDAYQKPTVKGPEALSRALTSKKGNKYDCIVTLSGGRDSTYVLYYATKVLGLRTLAYNYDNGFIHPQAQANMEAACEYSGVDLVQCKSKDNLNARIVASALRTTIPYGPGASCQLMCRQCYTGGLSFLYSTAEEYEIPYILWGDSLIERITFIPIRNKMFNKSPLRYTLSPQSPHFIRFLLLLRQLRNEKLPTGNSRMDVRFPKLLTPGIEEVHLFDYIEWDRNEILRAITDSLGWQKPAESISTWRFDCYLHALVNYCHKKAIGFNHDIDGLANMVRAGKMTRDEAMGLIEKGFDSDEWTAELDHLVREVIDLPDSEVEIMKSW
jgi:hypothetical protein